MLQQGHLVAFTSSIQCQRASGARCARRAEQPGLCLRSKPRQASWIQVIGYMVVRQLLWGSAAPAGDAGLQALNVHSLCKTQLTRQAPAGPMQRQERAHGAARAPQPATAY